MEDIVQNRVIIINAHFSLNLGGSEVQSHMIAQGLSKEGFQVLYIAIEGFNVEENYGYEIIGVDNNWASIFIVLRDFPQSTVYWRFNKKYYSNLVKVKNELGLKCIFSSSHIDDLRFFTKRDKSYNKSFVNFLRSVRRSILGLNNYRALLSSDAVIVNNSDQLSLFSHSNKYYIPNSVYTEKSEFKWGKPYVLWVGNLKIHKHPEKFLEACSALSMINEVDFLMIGSVYDEIYEELLNDNCTPSNFHFLGKRDILETNAAIAGSIALVHTCLPEGFPNVFLQAWAYSIPVISLSFDPEGVIESHESGYYSRTMDQFVNHLKIIIENTERRSFLGSNGRKLIDSKYNLKTNIKKLSEVIASVR